MNEMTQFARPAPKQGRARRTIDHILESAAGLLEEVGFEQLTTNLVCKRAELSPPALYHYFPNKYALLSELGLRLMEAQNSALEAFAEEFAGADDLVDVLIRALKGQIEVTEQTIGGRWIMRSLHASPQLCDIRTSSHAAISQSLASLIGNRYPQASETELISTIRLNVEIGYGAIEYLMDLPKLERSQPLETLARMIVSSLEG